MSVLDLVNQITCNLLLLFSIKLRQKLYHFSLDCCLCNRFKCCFPLINCTQPQTMCRYSLTCSLKLIEPATDHVLDNQHDGFGQYQHTNETITMNEFISWTPDFFLSFAMVLLVASFTCTYFIFWLSNTIVESYGKIQALRKEQWCREPWEKERKKRKQTSNICVKQPVTVVASRSWCTFSTTQRHTYRRKHKCDTRQHGARTIHTTAQHTRFSCKGTPTTYFSVAFLFYRTQFVY